MNIKKKKWQEKQSKTNKKDLWNILLFTFLLTTIITFFSIAEAETSSDVIILNYDSFIDWDGYYNVLGEVQNIGQNPIESIEITTTFYDENGSVVGTDTKRTCLDVLLPERKTPFLTILKDKDISEKITTYGVQIISYQYCDWKPIGLKIISNYTSTDEHGWLHIVGEVQNIGYSATSSIRMVATFYNENNTVVEVDWIDLPEETPFTDWLEPAEKTTFELLAFQRPWLITKYVLAAESWNYAIIPESPDMDITSPTIAVLSPKNKTYAVSDVPLSFTVSESTSWMGYSFDGQANNTIAGNTTILDLPDGMHTVIVYANDTAGNMGASNTVYFTVDTTPPNITDISQTPLENNVLPEDEVKVNATVTDELSGVKQVTLNYTSGDGTWVTVNMTKLEGNVWNATISAFPYGTDVTYKIIAEDNMDNTITTEELGYQYQYTVVPEFPTWTSMLLILIMLTVAIVIYKRRLPKH